MTRFAFFAGFGALLCGVASEARAEAYPVTAALTNSLGWTWNDKVKSSARGYYIGAQGAKIQSPLFGQYTALTSLVVRIAPTASCTRNLLVSPGDTNVTPLPSDTLIFIGWSPDAAVRAFSLTSTTGSQNLYLQAFEVFGVPSAPMPTALETCRSTRTGFTVRWKNDHSVCSNRVQVFACTQSSDSGEAIDYHYFNEYENTGGNPVNISDTLKKYHPNLSGAGIYLPARSKGKIQLSTGDRRGYLLHAGFSDYTRVTLKLVAAKYPYADEEATLPIACVCDGTTNSLAMVENDTAFKTHWLDLSFLPGDAQILLNGSGRQTHHRVIIDEMTFYRDYHPGRIWTNEVCCTYAVMTNATSVSNLDRTTTHIVRVTAFDKMGNTSQPAELEVLPFNRQHPRMLIVR